MVRNRSPTTRCTMRLRRRLPPSSLSALTFISRSLTVRVSIRLSVIALPPFRNCWTRSGGRISAQVAACYRQCDAGDVGGLFGREEQDGCRLLFGRSVSLHQAGASCLLHHRSHPHIFLQCSRLATARDASRRCLGAPRRNGADADAVLGVFEGEAGGDSVDATLRRSVG